jgi:hypothetical protein
MRLLTKLALLATLVLATIAGTATPASATSSVEVTSGTITTVLGNIDLTPGSQGPMPCPEKSSRWQFTTTTAPDRWTLSGSFSRQFEFPAGSGNWYQVDRTVLPGPGGAWSGMAPTQALTGAIGIQTRYYQLQLAGGPLNCAKTNLRCILTGAFTVAATSTYKAAPGAPGLPVTTSSDSATIDATSGPMVTSSCTPPWNGWGGTTMTLTNLQLTVL